MPRRALLLFALLALVAAAGAGSSPLRPFVAVESAALTGMASFQTAPEASMPKEAPASPLPDTTRQRRNAPRPSSALSKEFHAGRREAVLDALPEGGVALFFSSPLRTREGDVRYPYRQDSNLHYLTGAPDPASALMLAPAGVEVDGETVREVLFVPPRTEQSRRWMGPRLGTAHAMQQLGVEKAVSNERFAAVMERVAQRSSERSFFHLPLPYGIEEDSDLAGQVAAFREAARLMPEPDSPLTRRAVEVMRTVNRPDAFATFQEQLRQRLRPSAFRAALLQDAYHQFTTAASLADWDRWRSRHFGPARADGQLLTRLLDQMRVQKTPAEQRLMRRAAALTARAQKTALRTVEPGMREYEVEAVAEYVFAQHGAEAAFPSLVGSGPNADVFQHHHNRRTMQASELVVIDVGADVRGYTADVTRTAPVDGSFSSEERAIYELVLRAQQAAIRAARPGNNFRDPHQVGRRVLQKGLVEMGLLDDPDAIGRFSPHPTAHYLGRSVHDAGHGGPLEAGTVLAIEPGLYLPVSEDLPAPWRGISVRIEDVVLVTQDGPVVLSGDAPRAPEAVEALMRERRES